ATVQFAPGDTMTFTVRADDGDFDMQTLVWTEYNADTDQILNGPGEVDLPEQEGQIMTYRYALTRTVTGPAGNRRMELQVKDARGNLSNAYPIEYLVTD
ncbi:MAG TPA: hypothetical protein PLT69_12735, partial [Deltaproteobacteria bacterium]|nr:hypothetical protein [Deltaproteobacteria bacterium]